MCLNGPDVVKGYSYLYLYYGGPPSKRKRYQVSIDIISIVNNRNEKRSCVLFNRTVVRLFKAFYGFINPDLTHGGVYRSTELFARPLLLW